MAKKPATSIASDQEMDTWYKDLLGRSGEKPAAPGAAPDAAPAPTELAEPSQARAQWAPPAAGHVPEPDELDWQQRAGRGVAKTGAWALTGLGHLANQGVGLASPSMQRSLGDLAESVPGVKQMEEFGAQPYEGAAETIGGGLTQLAAGWATPELGLGRLVSGLGNMVAPTARFARGAALTPTGWGRAVGSAATAAESAGKGAIGGAIADPDNPVEGAKVGAVGGLAPPGLSRLLRSRAGQYVGGAMARAAPSLGLGAAVGYHGPFMHAAHHGVRSWHSPIGRWFDKYGRKLFDQTGKFIGYVNPLTGGLIAASAFGSGEGQPYPGSEHAQDANNPYTEEDYAPPRS